MPYKDADATLARLAEGFERFRSTWFEADRAVYDELVWQGQTPRVLVVGCSDSRADPQLITGARPGEIFTIRNVAALVPPYRPESVLAGVSSALEFGVKGLEVAHIVVMGHAMCGGIRSLMEHGDDDPRFEFVSRWVAQLRPAREEVEAMIGESDPASRARHAERAKYAVVEGERGFGVIVADGDIAEHVSLPRIGRSVARDCERFKNI
mgnify:CR=1 FL=1